MQTLNNPLKFDEGIFYPGAWEMPKQTNEFCRCSLLSVAAADAIYVLRKAGMDVYLADFNIADNTNVDASVSVVTRDGVHILILREKYRDVPNKGSTKTIELICRFVDLKERGDRNCVSSVTVPYVIKILKKNAHDIRKSLDSYGLATSISDVLTIVKDYAEHEKNNPSQRTQATLPLTDLTMLVYLVDGKLKQEELTPTMQNRITAARTTVQGVLNDHNGVRDLVNNFFSLPKWVVQYHAPMTFGLNGYYTIGALKVDCYKRGSRPDPSPNAVSISNYDYDIQWILPMQVYSSIDSFYELIGADAANDLSLAIKTDVIRHKDIQGFYNEQIGVPSYGTKVDFDTGTAYNRYTRAKSGLITAFMCDCNAVQP